MVGGASSGFRHVCFYVGNKQAKKQHQGFRDVCNCIGFLVDNFEACKGIKGLNRWHLSGVINSSMLQLFQ